MSNPQSNEPLDVDATRPAAAAPRSRIAKIRERHKGNRKPKELSIPRFEGEVVVKYGPLKTKTLTAASRGKSAALSNGKLLADACIEIYLRNEDGTLESIAQEEGLQHPVKFDGVLADLFELRGDTPAHIAVSMYRDNAALAGHCKLLWDWQIGADLDDDATDEDLEDLAGEEDAAT